MIKNSFQTLTEDEEISIDTSYNNGRAFVIFAYPFNATKPVNVGTVLFSSDEHGIWVNWLVVSNQVYDSTSFGSCVTNVCFQRSI